MTFFRFFFFPDFNLFEKGVDHFALGDIADHFPALEDDPLAVARSDADVRLARFARTVDHAAKHADLHRRLPAVQTLLQLGHDLLQIDGQAATGRAGDQFWGAHPSLR